MTTGQCSEDNGITILWFF